MRTTSHPVVGGDSKVFWQMTKTSALLSVISLYSPGWGSEGVRLRVSEVRSSSSLKNASASNGRRASDTNAMVRPARFENTPVVARNQASQIRWLLNE